MTENPKMPKFEDMTTDQKEKAQEVVVPVILTRIVSMAAFIMRRS